MGKGKKKKTAPETLTWARGNGVDSDTLADILVAQAPREGYDGSL